MRRLYLAAAAAALCLCLGGCAGHIYANYRELEELQVIQTLGIDWEDGRVVVSASSGRTVGDMSSSAISCSGRTVVDAMDRLQSFSSREELYYAHVKYLLIGQAAAERGLDEYLDFAARYPQIRLDTAMFVVKGGEARSLICAPNPDGESVTDAISSLAKDMSHSGSSAVFSCREIARALGENGAAVICAVEALPTEGIVFPGPGGSAGSDDGDGAASRSDGQAESGALAAVSSGFALIRDGRLCGFIPPEASKGLCMLLGRSGSGVTVLTDGAGNGVSLQFYAEAPRISFSPTGADIAVKVSAAVLETRGSAQLDDEAFLRFLDRRFTAQLQGWADQVTAAIRDLDADLLGLGSHIGVSRLTGGRPLRDMLSRVDIRARMQGHIERSYDLAGHMGPSPD